MQLILEDSFDNLSYDVELNESTGDKTYVVSGTFSTPDKKNRNGRVYSKKIWESNVSKYQEHILNNSINTLMEAEHPPRTTVDMWKAVGKIRKLEMRENIVYGEAIILNNNTHESNQLKSLIDAGIPIGVSTRGTGRMKGSIVEEYDLVTVDFVSSPSDYGANLKGIAESQELFTEDWILKDEEFTLDESTGRYVCTESGCSLQEGTGSGDIANDPITTCSKHAQELIEALGTFSQEPIVLSENEKLALKITQGSRKFDESDDADINENRIDKALSIFHKGVDYLRKELRGWDNDLLEQVDDHVDAIDDIIEGMYESVNETVNSLFEDGMSYEEIAKKLNISVAEVRKIEKRALRKLRVPSDKNKKFRQRNQNEAFKITGPMSCMVNLQMIIDDLKDGKMKKDAQAIQEYLSKEFKIPLD